MTKSRKISVLILCLALTAIGGAFTLSGHKFSNGNVFSYLEALVNDLGKGDYAAACTRVADNANVNIRDTMARPAKHVVGGKGELCGEFTLQAIAYTSGLVKDSFYKTDLKVTRDLLHWNLATVTYNEHHDMQKYEVASPIKTVHHVHIVLEGRDDGLLITEWTEVVEGER